MKGLTKYVLSSRKKDMDTGEMPVEARGRHEIISRDQNVKQHVIPRGRSGSSPLN